MRIYTANPGDATDLARELATPLTLRGHLAAREPNDSEMVSWLARREDHVLAEFAQDAAA
jgi:hypothetical protein